MKKIEQISPSMLVAFEKCKLKFILDSNVTVRKGPNYAFNPNSFLGNFIHKVLETYYTQFYDLELFDNKWETSFIEFSKKIQLDTEDIDIIEYIKYWTPAFYPKKINTLKILKNYKLLENSNVFPEKKVYYKNVKGTIDLYEVCGNKIRITDFKTGILYSTEDGVNIAVKEAYIEQLKTYGYIIYKTEQVKAENIELVIKGLGNNEMYSFKCSQEEYNAQGLKIERLINETNKVIALGNIAVLGTPEHSICNFCNHQFTCIPFHNSIRAESERWERIVLLKTINVTFDSSELCINILVNDRSISIHNIPENDFVAIKSMNENGKEVLLTQLFQVHNSNVKKWSKLTRYSEI
ncbi:PD-(D/E)XK nuclease family protein [Flavobacteriaceae bacterium]|nr:PD-(D/E)XK nuclease family protein [Flavobacteriaceae bacterium]